MRIFGKEPARLPVLAMVMGVLLVAGTGTGAWALPLFEENFDYDNGSALVGQGGWLQTGTVATNPITVTVPGLSYSGYPSSGIGGMVTLAASGQDVNHTITGQTSGSVYAAFLVNMSAISTTTGDYFFHFFDGAITSNTFRGRVFAKKDPSSANYAFGLRFGSGSTMDAYTGFNYSVGTTYLVVLKYTFISGTANDVCDLFIEPVISPTEPSPTLTVTDATQADCTNLDGVAIRQGSSAPQPSLDGIRVALSWADAVAGEAPPPTGACCNTATGACTITTEAGCGFTWLGQDVPCTAETCPVPPTPAACCAPNGSCTLTIPADCVAPSVFHAEWLSCEPNNCPQPTAACCAPAGTCTVTTEAACLAPSVWHPEWTSCTPNNCPLPPPTDRTICEVAADDPATMRPLLEGEYVRVTGLALVKSYQWQTTNIDFEITDGECCVTVFANGTSWPVVLAGDMIQVTGTVGFYNGKTEITTPNLAIVVISSGTPLPTPAEITTFELSVNGEQYDDCLVKIRCVEIVAGGDPWPITGSNANVWINDGSGITIMRIDKETDIDGSPQPTGKFTVVGLVTQYDTTSPYSDGYQILPRNLADLWLTDCPTAGACCFLDGHCEMLTEELCLAAPEHVTFLGAGIECEPTNPCAQPGACCNLDTGECTYVLQENCEFVFLGGPCLPNNPCPQPGACCDPTSGACSFVLQPLCPPEWTWLMGVPCAPTNPCPQPGACCDPDTGACTFVLQANCPTGWTWLVGVPCEPNNPCPPPVPRAACCDPMGNCTITTQVDCVAPSIWHPEWTSCVPNYCPPPVPTERTTWGKIKAGYR